MKKKEMQHLARMRAVRRMRDNGQFAVATLLRDTGDGFTGPDNREAGPLVLQSLVPAGFLRRMNRGKWQRSIEMLTESDLCPALVAGFELGEVQLRLVLPLLGAELRDALLSLTEVYAKWLTPPMVSPGAAAAAAYAAEWVLAADLADAVNTVTPEMLAVDDSANADTDDADDDTGDEI